MKLYNFFRSGTSHRLRIALNLKGLKPDYVAVDLRREAHLAPAFKALNPQGLVPALVLDDEQVLIQSPAIIEWLEETHPKPALLPADAAGRARVRALAAIVGCDIHPVNNRRILEALRHRFCHRDAPTLADVYLIPQIESARRFQVDLTRWPLISAIDATCAQLPAFADAAPGRQPDAG